MHGLPGRQNFPKRGWLARNRASIRVGRGPIQDVASPLLNGFPGQPEDLLRLKIGESDLAGAAGHYDADRAGFRDAGDKIAFAAEVAAGLFAGDGIADGAFESVLVELAFDQIIGRAGLHGLEVHFVVALAGEKDHGHPAALFTSCAEEVKPGESPETVIQQADLVFAALNGFQPGGVIVHPIQSVPAFPKAGDQLASDDKIILVVIDQQYVDWGVLHKVVTSRPAAVQPPQTSICPAP